MDPSFILDALVQWAPWTLSIGNLFFFLALLPTVRNPKAYIPRISSLPTGLWLLIFSLTFLAMGVQAGNTEWLWTGAIQACTSSTWLYIAAKRAAPPQDSGAA